MIIRKNKRNKSSLKKIMISKEIKEKTKNKLKKIKKNKKQKNCTASRYCC